MVARLVRDQKVVGSSPVTSTKNRQVRKLVDFILYRLYNWEKEVEVLGYHIEKKMSKCYGNNETLNSLINNVDEKTKLILEQLKQREGDMVTYEIYKNGEEVGFIEFNDINTSTPKIGVEIKKEFRRKGIAYTLLSVLMKEVSIEQKVKYFIYQVRGDNQASINLVEKLGGVLYKKDTFQNILSLSTYHILP